MSFDSQIYESFVPVYDAVPDEWDDAKPFLTEELKQISNMLNVREIGFFLETQLLTGKAIFPTTGPNAFRQIFRMTVPIVGGLSIGNTVVAHGINFDINFTLFDMWVAATNSNTFLAQIVTGNDVIMDDTNVTITSASVYDRANLIIEYMLEL